MALLLLLDPTDHFIVFMMLRKFHSHCFCNDRQKEVGSPHSPALFLGA